MKKCLVECRDKESDIDATAFSDAVTAISDQRLTFHLISLSSIAQSKS